MRCHLYHEGQIVQYFVATTAGQQSHYGTVVEVVVFAETLRGGEHAVALFYGIHYRVAEIVGLYSATSEIVDLEREYHEQLVYVTLYLLYTRLLPRPHLGCYVVIGAYAAFFCEPCHAQIETRIVYKNEYVGREFGNVASAQRH